MYNWFIFSTWNFYKIDLYIYFALLVRKSDFVPGNNHKHCYQNCQKAKYKNPGVEWELIVQLCMPVQVLPWCMILSLYKFSFFCESWVTFRMYRSSYVNFIFPRILYRISFDRQFSKFFYFSNFISSNSIGYLIKVDYIFISFLERRIISLSFRGNGPTFER